MVKKCPVNVHVGRWWSKKGQHWVHVLIECPQYFNRFLMEWSQSSVKSLNKISQQGVSKDYICKAVSKVDSKLYLDIFIAAIQWGENVNLLFCWERFNGLCRNCWWRDIADIHSYSALSIWSYFPNFWLYNTSMPPGAHFNTIKQDCRKILNFLGGQ